MLTRRQAVLAGIVTPVLLGLRSPPSLNNPFAQARVRAPDLGPQLGACKAAPPPVMGVMGVRFYTDAHNSVIDRNLRNQNNRAAAPLKKFTASIQADAASYIASRGSDTAAALCGAKALLNWARSSALTGKFNTAGLGHRMWNLCGFGAAYLAFRDGLGNTPAMIDPIEHWLAQIGELVAGNGSRWNNNLGCWAGAAAAVAGVAGNSRRCFDDGMSLVMRGITQIDKHGMISSEVARTSRAMNYHMFSLNALLMAAEIGMANGQDLYSANDNALGRLYETVLRNVSDPADFVRATGVRQEWNGPMKEDISWMEVWYSRFRDSRLLPYLKARRPIHDPYMGGNVTLMFGVPLSS